MKKMSKRISVVQIVTRMNTGGVAVLISDLVLEIDPATFEVVLVTGVCQEGEEDYLHARGIGLNEVSLPTLKRSLNPVLDVIAFLKIARVLFKLKPDIVHTHTSKAGVLGRIASKIFSPRSKIVHTYHGHLLHGYFSRIATMGLVLTEKSLARISDVLVAMGSEVKENLLHAKIGYEKQYKVALPGVRVKKPSPLNLEVNNFRNEHKDKIVFTFVGRLSPIKRCDRIIQLAKSADLRSSNIHFLIIGDGELRGNLESDSQGLPITFVGWQSNPEEWLAISDAAILLSDNEAVPLAMIEAGLAGLPVIATNVGSMADVVIDGVNGYLVDTSETAIVSGINTLANSPELRKAMGSKGREIALNNFTVEAMIQRHEEIYFELFGILD
jgi:glycosyltransferase involved in cell wall biosynthesis